MVLRLNPVLVRVAQTLVVVMLAGVTYLVIRSVTGEATVHALPEFSTNTGEPCATCHVNPGGGGPRTLRGLLWSARGRPDDVPTLPGLLAAPGVSSGVELYDVACAGCHGFSGEGLFGINLANTGISKAAARAFIRRGIPELEMPAFEGQFTDDQLDALSSFVADLGAGQIPPNQIALPAPQFSCDPIEKVSCGSDQ